jgi:hypothetical protein
MAGEWIKVRTNLWDDPRIGQLVELTGQGEAAVIGGLYWLWATADEHSSDGQLHGMTTRTIDRKTGVAGLGQALVTVGWLSDNADGVTVVRFDEHNGESAKTRAQTAKRVAKHKSNAKVTQGALPKTDQTVTGALPREDKRREEEPTSTHSASDQPELGSDDQHPALASPGVPLADLPTAVQLSIAMRKQGVETNPADPRLIALAAQGVTPDTVAAACEEAKRSRPNERIGLAYVAGILTRWAGDAAKLQATGAAPRQAGNAPGLSDKFVFSHLDRSGDQRAMDESMQRHGITVPGPDEEIEI